MSNSIVKTIDFFNDTLSKGCIWFYSVDNEVSMSSGIVMATWDSDTDDVEYTITENLGVGDTSGISLKVEIENDRIKLIATANNGNWAVKCQRMLI